MLCTQSLSTSHRPNNVLLCSIKNNHIENTTLDTAYCRFWGLLLLFVLFRCCNHDAWQTRPFLQKGVREPTNKKTNVDNTETNVDIREVILLQNLKNTEEILSWNVFLNLKSDHSHGQTAVTLVKRRKLSPKSLVPLGSTAACNVLEMSSNKCTISTLAGQDLEHSVGS